jgi:hypothetical protein
MPDAIFNRAIVKAVPAAAAALFYPGLIAQPSAATPFS